MDSNNLSEVTIAVTDSPLDGPVVCLLDINNIISYSWTCMATYTIKQTDINNGDVTNHANVTLNYSSLGELHTVSAIASAIVSLSVGPRNLYDATVGAPTHISVIALPTQPVVPPLFALPILTGDVTFCDPATRIINLRFAPGFDPQNFNHQVTIDGVVMVCEVNSSNKTLLSCKYPVSVVFPAAIQVTLDGVILNEFVFDGTACAEPDQSSKPTDTDPVCVPLPGMVCP